LILEEPLFKYLIINMRRLKTNSNELCSNVITIPNELNLGQFCESDLEAEYILRDAIVYML